MHTLERNAAKRNGKAYGSLMKTSSFWKYRTGGNRIAISRSVPDGLEPGFKRYLTLAPGPWFKSFGDDKAGYIEAYQREILDPLDPHQEWETLHQLAGGEEPILLCWEPLRKPHEFCHRRLVAAWFERELGVEIPEFTPEEAKKETPQLALF